MPRKFNWTPELAEKTFQLYWSEQKSPVEIIAILNLPLSSQAITCMFHRLGIPVRTCAEALFLRPKRTLTEEHRYKTSQALKGRPLTRVGFHHTEETREKLHLFNLGNQRGLGYRHTDSAKQRMSKTRMGHPVSSEARFKMSTARKQLWKNPSYAEKAIRSFQMRPTAPELKVIEAIKVGNLPFVYNGNRGEFIISGKCPDFVNINGDKALIEVFGDYWHKEEDESKRKEVFIQYGFKTLILWESHIKEVSVDELASEITAFKS